MSRLPCIWTPISQKLRIGWCYEKMLMKHDTIKIKEAERNSFPQDHLGSCWDFHLDEVWRHRVVAYTCRHQSVRGNETLVAGIGGGGHWTRGSIAPPELAGPLISCTKEDTFMRTHTLTTGTVISRTHVLSFYGASGLLFRISVKMSTI
jgi:hypothetical protein